MRSRLLVMFVLLGGLCVTGFAERITLTRPIPSFNQAYTDGPEAWGPCNLGTGGCPDTLHQSGCLVTAMASVLGYYDIAVDVPAAASWTGSARSGMDPGLLNDWLKLRGAFGKCSQDLLGSCCLDWSRLPTEIALVRHENRSDVGLNPVSAVVIDHALRQGLPVVAGVHYGASCNSSPTQSENCHWIVLTGRAGNTYTIIDPYNPDTSDPRGVSTTLDRGSRGAYTIDRFYVVELASSQTTDLVARFEPQQPQVGATQRCSLRLPGTSTAVLIYAMATDPRGRTRYAHYDTNAPSASDNVQWSTAPRTLIPSPRTLETEWVWRQATLTTDDLGTWTWTIWTEEPARPGIRFAETVVSYDVRRPGQDATAESASPVALLLILVVVAGVIYLVASGATR